MGIMMPPVLEGSAMKQKLEAATNYMERLWDLGQQHLAAGRYVAARDELERAEGMAWRQQNAGALARIYLPLLEARRQIRQNAADGVLVITPGQEGNSRRMMEGFREETAGTLICGGAGAEKGPGAVPYAARQRQSCLEALVLVEHRGERRLASMTDPTFAGGLPVAVTSDPKELVDPVGVLEFKSPKGKRRDAASTVNKVPLPGAGRYAPGHPLHDLARESLLVAWEALALKWQARHPVRVTVDAGWEELAWLRLALRVDPACEPIMMRIISLAENLQRAG